MFGKWSEINENSSEKEIEQFYDELLAIVDDYTTFPKPRGKGGAPFINECTSSIMSGVEALGRIQRMDLVIQILDKLAENKEHLKGPNYEMWIGHIKRCAKGDSVQKAKENYAKLHDLRPDLY